MNDQVIRVGCMPNMPGMLLMEEGGDKQYNDSSNFTGLIEIEKLVKDKEDERYRQLTDTTFFLNGRKNDNEGMFVWDNGIEINTWDINILVDDEDVVYLWDQANPVLGREITAWEAPNYRGRIPLDDPVFRFGIFPDRADVFLCELDWSLWSNIGGKRGTYLVNIERLINEKARDGFEYERYRQLLRPEILVQAHIDLAGWLFWPYNLFVSGYVLGAISEEAEESLWEKTCHVVYSSEDKEKPKWKG